MPAIRLFYNLAASLGCCLDLLFRAASVNEYCAFVALIAAYGTKLGIGFAPLLVIRIDYILLNYGITDESCGETNQRKRKENNHKY